MDHVIEPGAGDATIRLLDRFLRAMDALTGRLDEVYLSNENRRDILESAALSRQLGDAIRSGQSPDELVPVVEALTESLQISATMWLSSFSTKADPPSAHALHTEVRVAFYELRAHLFPDGKP